SPLLGLSTGFVDLDEQTAGLVAQDFIIIAARPSAGKTALAANIAAANAADGKTVLFFSLEQPQQQILDRIIAARGKVDSHRLRTGKLLEEDWGKVSSTVGALKD